MNNLNVINLVDLDNVVKSDCFIWYPTKKCDLARKVKEIIYKNTGLHKLVNQLIESELFIVHNQKTKDTQLCVSFNFMDAFALGLQREFVELDIALSEEEKVYMMI